MKKNNFTIVFVFCFAFMGIAQNTVTVDASADQLGYAAVFNFDGSLAFGEPWGVPELQTIVDPANNTMSLHPNFNTSGDNPTDPFWVNQTSLLGNKFMRICCFCGRNDFFHVGSTFAKGNVRGDV